MSMSGTIVLKNTLHYLLHKHILIEHKILVWAVAVTWSSVSCSKAEFKQINPFYKVSLSSLFGHEKRWCLENTAFPQKCQC